jgi:hypothetical protein
MSWEADDLDAYFDVILDEIPDRDPDQELRDRLRGRLEEEDSYVLGEADWDKLEQIALRLAPSNFKVADYLTPETWYPPENLSSIVTTKKLTCHPFRSLRNLTLDMENTFELYLIFYSHLFPKLRYLKLMGQIDSHQNVSHDVKMFRHSVTA